MQSNQPKKKGVTWKDEQVLENGKKRSLKQGPAIKRDKTQSELKSILKVKSPVVENDSAENDSTFTPSRNSKRDAVEISSFKKIEIENENDEEIENENDNLLKEVTRELIERKNKKQLNEQIKASHDKIKAQFNEQIDKSDISDARKIKAAIDKAQQEKQEKQENRKAKKFDTNEINAAFDQAKRERQENRKGQRFDSGVVNKYIQANTPAQPKRGIFKKIADKTKAIKSAVVTFFKKQKAKRIARKMERTLLTKAIKEASSPDGYDKVNENSVMHKTGMKR